MESVAAHYWPLWQERCFRDSHGMAVGKVSAAFRIGPVRVYWPAADEIKTQLHTDASLRPLAESHGRAMRLLDIRICPMLQRPRCATYAPLVPCLNRHAGSLKRLQGCVSYDASKSN